MHAGLPVADLFFHTELCSSMGLVEAGNWLRSSICPVQTEDWLSPNAPHESSTKSVSEATARTQTFKCLQRRNTMDRQLRLQVEQFFEENVIAHTPSDGQSWSSALSSAATSRQNSSSPVRLRPRPSSNTDDLKRTLGISQSEDMQVSAACQRLSASHITGTGAITEQHVAFTHLQAMRGRNVGQKVIDENGNFVNPESLKRPHQPTATSIHQHDFDGSNIAMLVQEHGDKAYLLFTDAAHQLLDSSTSLPNFKFKRTPSYSF